MLKKLVSTAVFILGATISNADSIDGNLVIVGGALGNNTKDVYEVFIELAGGNDAKIGIIPTASGKLNSSKNFKKDLVNYGIREENIFILPITKHDFKGTDENEAETWKGNENKEEIVSLVKEMNGIWFVGGDQTLITQALRNDDGSNSKVLDGIWKTYKKGAVLGGTSAGAAIMSDVMIAAGDSLGALKNGIVSEYGGMESQEAGPLYVEKGLGFFRHGVIDQHYDAKARLGRTILASFELDKSENKAYGIDENTALIYKNRENIISVAGTGHVTVIDKSEANKTGTASNFIIENVKVSLLSKGDILNLDNNEMNFGKKSETKGYEYMTAQLPLNTGAVSTYGQLKHYLSYGLVDNKITSEAKTYSFDESGLGYEWTFKKGKDTNGYYGTKNGGVDDYSIKDVYLDIFPVQVDIKRR